MEKVVALTKRRGFIFPSSEIYGGLSGFYDYGPYGVALKRAIRELWWRHMVDLRDDVVGLESTLIMPSQVWAASGHLEVEDDHVQLEVMLPWLLQRFAEVAQIAIRNRGNLLLTKRS